MRDSDYYPAGAYNDPNAPYNEVVISEEEFDVEVVVTMAKTTIVVTDDYNPQYDEEDGYWKDTDNTDWNEAYKSSCFTIPQMLDELHKFLDRELKRDDLSISERVRYKNMLSDCEDWEMEDCEVNEL